MAEKLTPEEIIKALECCITTNKKYNCEDCPYRKILGLCFDKLNKDAIDLINRQQAEIERLQQETKNTNGLRLEIFENKSVWERLARAKAIKEFAERLKNSLKGYGGFYCQTTMNVRIDKLVKEMVGEK